MESRLRERRQELGLTAVDVAKLIAVSDWTVRSWEMGRTRPSSRHLRALARVLKSSPADLGLEPSPPMEASQPQGLQRNQHTG